MYSDTYDIRQYDPDLLFQVTEVLCPLWGSDLELNRTYFQWKYIENPNADQPLGVVALQRGKVVGFRGYFALRYLAPGLAEPMGVLVPGDTLVHPDHRRKNLSVRMGTFAAEAFSSAGRYMMNMTATRSSLPGYLRLGFLPLAKKQYVSAYGNVRFLLYLITWRSRPAFLEQRIRKGGRQDVEVADLPYPEEMAALIAASRSTSEKIQLVKDEDFFRWRFSNPRKTYRFYLQRRQGHLTGYIVLGFSPNYRRGYILDFAQKDETSVVALLSYLRRQRHVDILSIYNFSAVPALENKLAALGFRRNGLVRFLERCMTSELPVLIHPVSCEYTDSDWMAGKVDVRDINHWQLMEISSDAV